MVKTLLTKARDARWMWNLFGPIYNRQIYDAICELYEDIAGDEVFAGPTKALDVGTGPGYLTLLLAAQYPTASYIGIDFSTNQVRVAEKLRQKKGVQNCSYQQGNAMDIPFANDYFDVVFSVGSIKHWPDPERGMAEIRRVLAPGQWTVILETDKDASSKDIRQFAERFSAWFLWDRLLVWGLKHIIFGRSFSQQEIAHFAQKAGFRIIKTERHALCPYIIVKAQK
jgi:ubiquinone/menaquinone biosynthesis C-methylase UbiE